MNEHLDSLGKYAQHVVAIFREKTDGEYSPADYEIPFDRDDIDRVERQYDLKRINNPGDLPYNMRGRADLPSELTQHGYDAVIQDVESEQKEAAYLITKEPQIIDLPPTDDIGHVDPTPIPRLVRSFSSFDEQSVFSFILYTELISDVVGFEECHYLQSHLRTSGPAGQIEVDSVYIGRDGRENQLILIEGKDADEEFVRNQLFKNTYTIRKLVEYPDEVTVLGVQAQESDIFSIVEFDVPESRDDGTVEVSEHQRFAFNQKSLSAWA